MTENICQLCFLICSALKLNYIVNKEFRTFNGGYVSLLFNDLHASVLKTCINVVVKIISTPTHRAQYEILQKSAHMDVTDDPRVT